MAIIFAEISKNNTIYIIVKFFAELRKYGPSKARLEIPEGSTLNSIIKKYRIPQDENLIVLINRKPSYNKNLILKTSDIIAIFPPLAEG